MNFITGSGRYAVADLFAVPEYLTAELSQAVDWTCQRTQISPSSNRLFSSKVLTPEMFGTFEISLELCALFSV